MSDQITIVTELFSKKKYKKALSILNKINKKQPDFLSLHYTGACYFYEKKYAQANLYYLKALKLADQDSQKIGLLSNMAITQAKLGDRAKAIKYYIDLLTIDGSVTNAEHRDSLCRLAAEQQDHQVLFDYAPKLLNWAEYATTGLYLLLQAHLQIPDNDENIQIYLKKLQGEIATYDSEQVVLFVKLLLSTNNQAYIKEIADVVEKRFSHEVWFKQLKVLQDGQSAPSPLTDIPKERVVGGNDELVALVTDLLEHSESLGAYFHPALKVFEDNGNLSVKVFEQTEDNQKLISIPLPLLPVLSDFDFALGAGGTLQATPVDDSVNPDAAKTMVLLKDIYNATDKLNQWKESFPFVALQNHLELLKTLCSANPSVSKNQRFMELLEDKQVEQLTIESFLGSRRMRIDQQVMKKYGIACDGPEAYILLSVIDFLNHKIGFNPYKLNDGELRVLGPADINSHELFVHYSNFDPLMTYLYYGFVDPDAPYCYSIPLELTKLDGQLVRVFDGTQSLKKEGVADELKHLSNYLPQAIVSSNGVMELDKLMIPCTGECHLLREVLMGVLSRLNNDATPGVIEQEMLHLEKQIISKNLAYWQQVQSLLDVAKSQEPGNKAFVSVEQLIGFYRSHYQKYSAKLGISLF